MKKQGVNRRDFLRLSATAGVSTLLIPEAKASVSG
ncbi:MAG: twin-arginine translocation signal domain-containing protein [Tannerellaceae bacterium]|nr:twin-arginine translocation signal domain-containing protein [Tannerellaceae bacterium]